MKAFSKTLLLLAGMNLLLAGCQKGGTQDGTRKAVRFTAESYSVATKTGYGQYVSAENWQSIDWVNGDQIRITSPEATHRYDVNRHYAEYKVKNASQGPSPGKTGNPSKAELYNAGIEDPDNDPGISNPSENVDANVNGLVWGDATTYHFFSIYPSPAINTGVSFPIKSGDYNVAELPIPNVQGFTREGPGMVLKPDMKYADLGASVQTGANADVELVFKPLFTAFEITLDCESDALLLRKVELNSDSKAMAGSY